MESKLIRDKYLVFPTPTIVLPVDIKDLPQEIVVDGTKLVLKASFHVSLVCISKIIEKHHVLTPDFADSVIKDFDDFVEKNDIGVLEYLDEFKYVERDDLKTVVVMCKVAYLNNFFDLINKKFNLNIEYPPTHVTLYTIPGGKGIFLTDSSDIKNLTKPIPNPIGRTL